MKRIKQTDNEQIIHQVIINKPSILNGEILIIHMPNEICTEWPASITNIDSDLDMAKALQCSKRRYLSRVWYYRHEKIETYLRQIP